MLGVVGAYVELLEGVFQGVQVAALARGEDFVVLLLEIWHGVWVDVGDTAGSDGLPCFVLGLVRRAESHELFRIGPIHN